MSPVPLSVVVCAKNEEQQIAECLASVSGWAADIVVVDDESTDRTAEIAARFTDRILRRRMDREGLHRNWAYAQARHDWVLSLDADERVTEGLKKAVEGVLGQKTLKAFALPLRTYIGNHWVRHGGWYPASKIRLFQKNFFHYEDAEVHPRAFVDGPTGTLTDDIIHIGYPDFAHFLASLNRQTTLEAAKWVRTGRRMTAGRLIRRSVDRFFRSYLRKRGFKDGFLGFMVAYFASLYQVMSYAKYWELTHPGAGTPPETREPPQTAVRNQQ